METVPKFRRWTVQEEMNVLAELKKGRSVAEVAAVSDRSARAILIRVGTIMARSEGHPDTIPRDRLIGIPSDVLERAQQMFHEQQERSPTGATSGGGSQAAAGLDTQKILDAIQLLHKDVRKLRAQMKAAFPSTPSH